MTIGSHPLQINNKAWKKKSFKGNVFKCSRRPETILQVLNKSTSSLAVKRRCTLKLHFNNTFIKPRLFVSLGKRNLITLKWNECIISAKMYPRFEAVIQFYTCRRLSNEGPYHNSAVNIWSFVSDLMLEQISSMPYANTSSTNKLLYGLAAMALHSCTHTVFLCCNAHSSTGLFTLQFFCSLL